jgi:outer membrane receptor protein involved in Fe transport
MRIPTPIQEIPRSIEAVTRQVMEDQKVIRMSDALRNVSGVFLSQSAGGRLRSTLVAFNITKRNVLTTDPVNGPAFSVTAGEQRGRGFEFDLNGEIWPGWNVIATYAYMDAKVTEDNTFAIGSRLANVPLHQGSLWTTYFIQDGLAKGFGAGVGMLAQERPGYHHMPESGRLRNAVRHARICPAGCGAVLCTIENRSCSIGRISWRPSISPISSINGTSSALSSPACPCIPVLR